MAESSVKSTAAPFRLLDIGAIAFAVVMTLVIVRAINDTNDFTAFYAAAKGWRLNAPVANDGPLDLNPPTFSILLAPLTFFSAHVARVLWTLMSVVALADALRRIRAKVGLSSRALLWVSCACIGLQPAVFAWGLGQVTWILLWLITRAWLAADRSAARAGAWLGFAVAVKPPLALMALLLPLPVCASAAAVSSLMTVATLPLSGIGPWRVWLSSGGKVDWLAWWPNASLWGVAARIHVGGLNPVTLHDLPVVTFATIAVLGLSLALLAIRARGASRWTLAGLWSLALSPLGWTYYLPIVLGPALAIPPRRKASLWLALALLTLPTAVFAPADGQMGLRSIIGGSVYCIALGALWVAWTPTFGKDANELRPHEQPRTVAQQSLVEAQ